MSVSLYIRMPSRFTKLKKQIESGKPFKAAQNKTDFSEERICFSSVSITQTLEVLLELFLLQSDRTAPAAHSCRVAKDKTELQIDYTTTNYGLV